MMSDIILLDGATGSELERRGVEIGLPLWSANAILHAPEVVQQVHRDYLEAGARAITTNTFRTHQRSLAKAGMGDRAGELTRIAVEIARAARDGANTDALVLGAVAPLEDCYRPHLAPDGDTCHREHAQCIEHLVEAGVDMVWIETMCSAREATAAADAARSIAPSRWGISFCLADDGKVLDGTALEDIIPAIVDARWIGINCVAATVLARHVAMLRSALDTAGLTGDAGPRIAAYGNVGHADGHGAWISTDAVAPKRFAEHAMDWVHAGATVVGGCCGTTPATIEHVSSMLTTAAKR